MIRRKRIDAGLDIGEILREQRPHVGVEALVDAVTGSRLWLRAFSVSTPNLLGQSAQHIHVPGIPGHARQLARRIGDARRKT